MQLFLNCILIVTLGHINCTLIDFALNHGNERDIMPISRGSHDTYLHSQNRGSVV